MKVEDIKARGYSDSSLIRAFFDLYGSGVLTSREEALLSTIETQGWSAPGDPAKYNGWISDKQRKWAFDIVSRHND